MMVNGTVPMRKVSPKLGGGELAPGGQRPFAGNEVAQVIAGHGRRPIPIAGNDLRLAGDHGRRQLNSGHLAENDSRILIGQGVTCAGG